MTKGIKVIVCVIVTTFLIGTLTMSAAAFGPNPGGKMPNRLAKILNLTDDQQQKLLVIHQDFQKNTLPVRQKLQMTRFELNQLWKADSLDQNKIEAKVKVMTDLRIQLVQKRREMFNKTKAVLTSDQLKTLENYRNRTRQQFRFNHMRPSSNFPNGMNQQDNNTAITQ
jgi:Spy/CpxP family protein refolding chaperone